ncbi:hypothetical protein EB001_14815 [bacterium]|nr:hypothetical protein [bacterium]
MNERIKELYEQAHIEHRQEYSSPTMKTVSVTRQFDPELFAELIIKECSKVIVNGGYRNPAFGEKHTLTPPEIDTMIKEHFGVE